MTQVAIMDTTTRQTHTTGQRSQAIVRNRLSQMSGFRALQYQAHRHRARLPKHLLSRAAVSKHLLHLNMSKR